MYNIPSKPNHISVKSHPCNIHFNTFSTNLKDPYSCLLCIIMKQLAILTSLCFSSSNFPRRLQFKILYQFISLQRRINSWLPFRSFMLFVRHRLSNSLGKYLSINLVAVSLIMFKNTHVTLQKGKHVSISHCQNKVTDIFSF